MKKPRWPSVSARHAFQPFQIWRRQSSTGSTIASMNDSASGQTAGCDTVFQNSRSFAMLDQKDTNYGFDAQKGDYCDMVKSGIIDPVKVVNTALQDAASVAGSC